MADKRLWESLSSLDPKDVSNRACARITGHGIFEMNVCNRIYIINTLKQQIIRKDTADRDDEWLLSIPVTMYLFGAQNVTLKGIWVSPKELPGGAQFFTGVHAVPVEGIIKNFGNNMNKFQLASQFLGGESMEYGDSSFSFTVFPRLPVGVVLWLADDEFESRASMLVDPTAHMHLPLDALLGALRFLCQILIEVTE